MTPRRWIAVGAVAALLVAAGSWAVWMLRADDDRGASDPGIAVDELDCVRGIYANTDFALDGDDGGDFIVCRYQELYDPSSAMTAHLVSSSRLTTAESTELRAAVAHSPRGELPFGGCEPGDDGPGEFFLVRTADQVAYWVYNAVCGDNGLLAIGANGKLVHRHDTARLLTALGSAYGRLGPPTG